MKKTIISIGILVSISAFSVLVFAFPGYIGYSGAPGSSGTCASTCHGSTGGTIQVMGFPSEYIPGNTYTITISHNGGSSISNFNGSCRIGNGQQNAGVITAGTGTSVYNTSGETNGIHFSSNNQNSGTFNWTAPSSGTGTVRLYIAGQQGSKSGPNTALVLTSSENTTGIHGISENTPTELSLYQNYPNPFNPVTKINFDVPKNGFVILKVYDISGKEMQTLVSRDLTSGSYSVKFNAAEYTSGIYLYKLESNGHTDVKKMMLVK